MDNKTWSTQQRSKPGSSGTGGDLQALQHRQLSSSATGSIYPGGISALSNQTHWQRVACCGSLNGAASGQSQLLSHQQQQPQQNQLQRQTTQLRYFRVEKSSNPKYPSPVPLSTASGGIQQQQQQQQQQVPPQQHLAHHYALLAASSPLSPSTVSASNSIPPDRSCQHNTETQSYCYFNPCQSGTATQSLTLKPAEELHIDHHHLHHNYYHHHHHHHPSSRNNPSDQNNQQEISQSLSALSPAYQPRYRIVANGHFAIPAAGKVSLTTTCFALTSTNATSLEASVYASTSSGGSSSSSSSSLVDQVSSQPEIIPACRPPPSLPRFVNAFEAVPDMLRDVRPGSPPIAPRSRLAPFTVGQPEFSYHAGKPQSSVSLEATTVQSDKNWPELSLKSRHRPVAPTSNHLDHSAAIAASPDKEKRKTVWKKIAPAVVKEKSLQSSARRSPKRQTTLQLERKSYAAAVQVTGSQDIRERSRRDRMSEVTSTRLRIQEARRASNVARASPFYTSTPNKTEPRMTKKREYDSCEEDTEYYSSTSTVSSGTNDTLSRTPEGFSSPEGGTLTNWRGSSSSSSLLQELDEDQESSSFEGDGRASRVPSRKRLCKMAESFCFGQLENEAFFRAFDEYNRRRRRMSYTRRLEEAETGNPNVAADAEGPLTLERRTEGVHYGKDPIFRNLVYAALQQSAMIAGQSDGNVRIRMNGIEGQGAFKVLQKLRECADGTGALYTNSWRPEELHFLRRCYQNKNV